MAVSVLKTDLTPRQQTKEWCMIATRSRVCRARVSDVQNRTPRRCAHLLRLEAEPVPMRRRHAGLSDSSNIGLLLERLGLHPGRRTPRLATPLSRGSVTNECPQLSCIPHLVTPLAAYCTAPTSSFPRPSLLWHVLSTKKKLQSERLVQ